MWLWVLLWSLWCFEVQYTSVVRSVADGLFIDDNVVLLLCLLILEGVLDGGHGRNKTVGVAAGGDHLTWSNPTWLDGRRKSHFAEDRSCSVSCGCKSSKIEVRLRLTRSEMTSHVQERVLIRSIVL